MKRSIVTGSQPYSDGSGCVCSIEVCDSECGPQLWLAGGAVIVQLEQWSHLRDDIDRAIAAFGLLTAPAPKREDIK